MIRNEAIAKKESGPQVISIKTKKGPHGSPFFVLYNLLHGPDAARADARTDAAADAVLYHPLTYSKAPSSSSSRVIAPSGQASRHMPQSRQVPQDRQRLVSCVDHILDLEMAALERDGNIPCGDSSEESFPASAWGQVRHLIEHVVNVVGDITATANGMGEEPGLGGIAYRKHAGRTHQLPAIVDGSHAPIIQPAAGDIGKIGTFANGKKDIVGLDKTAVLGINPLFVNLFGIKRPLDPAAQFLEMFDFVPIGTGTLDIDGRHLLGAHGKSSEADVHAGVAGPDHDHLFPHRRTFPAIDGFKKSQPLPDPFMPFEGNDHGIVGTGSDDHGIVVGTQRLEQFLVDLGGSAQLDANFLDPLDLALSRPDAAAAPRELPGAVSRRPLRRIHRYRDFMSFEAQLPGGAQTAGATADNSHLFPG